MDFNNFSFEYFKKTKKINFLILIFYIVVIFFMQILNETMIIKQINNDQI